MDPDVLKSKYNVRFEDLWSLQCKFYKIVGNMSNCMPCMVFKPLNEWIMGFGENVRTYIIIDFKCNKLILV